MKQKLVDAEAIILQVQRNLIPGTDEAGMVFVNDAERYFISLLKNAPEAKFGDIKYAQRTLHVGSKFVCSNCGTLSYMENYCSHCGAKVKEGDI